MRARGKEREMHLLKPPISLFIKEETQNEIKFNFESSTSKKGRSSSLSLFGTARRGNLGLIWQKKATSVKLNPNHRENFWTGTF